MNLYMNLGFRVHVGIVDDDIDDVYEWCIVCVELMIT